MMARFFFLAAVLGIVTNNSAFALPDCMNSAVGLSVIAAGAQEQQSTAYECALNGEEAIHLGGKLSSGLLRAQGFVDIAFFDERGKRLWLTRRGPWLGKFSSLLFDESVAVPVQAKRLRILASVESNRKDATGQWVLSDLTVSRGRVIVGEALNGPVISVDQSAQWRLGSVPAVAGTFTLVLSDRAGNILISRNVEKGTSERVDVDLGKLSVGYYDVAASFASIGGRSAVWHSSLVVLPQGEVPSEPRFGMDAALSWYGGGADKIAQSVFLLRQAGIGSLRDRMTWSKIQPDRYRTDWGVFQSVAKVVEAGGMESVQSFHDSPAWARPGVSASGARDRQPALDESALFAFGRSFAQGLGKTVRSVEYWNEQNSDFFPSYPFHYASGFKAFSAGVKSVDPNIRVLIGAAAGKPGQFFQETYKNDVSRFMDVRNQHFYGAQAEIEDFRKENLLAFERDNGVSRVPGWLTEMGYSLQRDVRGDWRNSENAQAAYLVKTYAGGFAAGYERVFFFFWRERIEADHYTWGILRDDFSPRPAYLALSLLTRHLAGASVVASEATGNGRSVYFQKSNGEYVAVAWGDGVNLSRLGAGIEVRDIFGGTVSATGSSISSAQPVLVSKIKVLPTGVAAVSLPQRNLQGPVPLRLSVNVLINGRDQRNPGKNRSTLSVLDGAPIDLGGQVFGKDGSIVDIECLAGRGVEIVSPAKQTLPKLAANGTPFACRFKSSLASVGESFIGVQVKDGSWSDRAVIAIVPDVASAASLHSRAPEDCPVWGARNSANMEMTIKPASKWGLGCPQVRVTTRIVKRGDSWAFPVAQIAGSSDLRAYSGIRLRFGDVPDIAPIPRPLMAQLVEKNGGVWLIDLHSDRDRHYLSGLFSLARAAPWSRDDNGKLDLNNIREIMIGWGGYGGEAGQQHGFLIEEFSWLRPRN